MKEERERERDLKLQSMLLEVVEESPPYMTHKSRFNVLSHISELGLVRGEGEGAVTKCVFKYGRKVYESK
jgi:hypothetical protein